MSLSPLIDFIDPNFITVDINTNIKQVLEKMSRFDNLCTLNKVRDKKFNENNKLEQTCVLITENDHLKGIFTQRDLVKLSAQGIKLKNLTLKDVITRPIISIKESETKDIFTVLNIFKEHKIRHLPIINNQGKTLGIISHNSLIKSFFPHYYLTQVSLVRDIMTTDIIYGNINDSLLKIANLMTENMVSCVIICDNLTTEKLTPVGIITERDILQFQALELDLSKINSFSVMSAPLFSLKPDDSILFAQETMNKKRVRRLVVLGENKELLGLITTSNILQIFNPNYMYGMLDILQNIVLEKNEQLQQKNLQLEEEVKQKQAAEISLKLSQGKLQQLVEEKTRELKNANQQLAADLVKRQQIEKDLQSKTQQLENTLNNLQKTQMQLIQTEKMSSLGQLIAGIAHEINNPINFIYGNLNYAEEYLEDFLDLLGLYDKYYPHTIPEIRQKKEEIDLEFMINDLKKLLFSMKSGTERIRKLVISLRNFSHLDHSELRWINIHDPLENSLLILQNQLKIKGTPYIINVIKNYAELEAIECFPGQITQVVMNILSNAIDALKDSTFDQLTKENNLSQLPEITITTKSILNDYIAIKIKDNGKGIKKEVLKHLFDPFFTTKPVGKGTGLGLSISYQIIVEQHQGRLYCNSKLGEGTEFIIEIPKQQNQVKSKNYYHFDESK